MKSRSVSAARNIQRAMERGAAMANGLSSPDGNVEQACGIHQKAGLNGTLTTKALKAIRWIVCPAAWRRAPMANELLLARLPAGFTFLTPVRTGRMGLP